MYDNTVVNIRPMQLDDIGNSLLLSQTEGWNQTEKDWKRLAGDPRNICLVAECLDRIVGTATAMNYDNKVAWIGMVLVDKDYRGRGISKILLSGLLNQLKNCTSVKLDATPAGKPVYEKFGFVDEYTIYRMTNPSVGDFRPGTKNNSLLPVLFSDIPGIAALDHTLFGAGRVSLINSLVRENPEKAWLLKQQKSITGFALGRQGNKYHQIGPVFASSSADAKELIIAALSGLLRQSVVIDVLSDKDDLIRWLSSIGFSSQRYFVRMYLKSNPLPGIPRNQFLICGPEFG